MRLGHMQQRCWLCGATGVPIRERGWFELQFSQLAGSTPERPVTPQTTNAAVCPRCSVKVAELLSTVKGDT